MGSTWKFGGRILVMWMCVMVLVSSGIASAEKQKIIFGAKGDVHEQLIAAELVEQFNAMHPNVEVEIIYTAGHGVDFNEYLGVLFASGVAPDVFRSEYQKIAPFLVNDWLYPLDHLIEADANFDLSDFYPASIEAHTYNGHVYGIPQEAQPFTMFFNETVLEEAGIAMPPNDWNIDTLREMASKTMEVDETGHVSRYGWRLDYSLTRIMPFLYAFGGRLLNDGRTEFLVDSPENRQGLEFMQDAYKRDVIGGVFQNGTATFYLGGPWMVPSFRATIENDFDWDILPVPGGPGGRATTLGSDAYYVSSQTQHPEAAWEFIKFITNEQSLAYMSENGSIVPARRRVAEEYVFYNPVERPYNMQAYIDGIDLARPSPVITEWDRLGEIMGPVWQNIIEDRQSVGWIEAVMPALEALLEVD